MFKGQLKIYQLKGMNWLASLYDQVLVVMGRKEEDEEEEKEEVAVEEQEESVMYNTTYSKIRDKR